MVVNSDAIISFLRNNGPSTSIDVARALRENSLIVSAILVDTESQKKIKVSRRRFGDVKRYYLPEQHSQIEKMVSNTLTPEEKTMLERIMNEKAVSELDITAQESAMIILLEDLLPPFIIEYENYRLKCWRIPSIEEANATEIVIKRLIEKFKSEPEPVAEEKKEEPAPVEEPKPVEAPKPEPIKAEPEAKPVEELPEITAEEPQEPVIEEPKPLPKPEEQKKSEKQQKLVEEPAAKAEDFRTTVRTWFENNDIDVEEERELEEGKIYEYEINMPTAIGKQGYIAKIIINKKKSTGQGEVSSFGTYVSTKRVPGLLISNTGFAKSAVKYWKKELSDIIMLVSNEDLEN